MDAPFLGSTSGLTRQQLRTVRLARVSRDVYVLRERAEVLRDRVLGLQLAVDGAVASHATAAQLLRLPAPHEQSVHLTRPPGTAAVRREGVVAHVRALPPEDVLDLDGLRVTAPVRVLLDLGPALRPVDLVVLADAVAARAGLAVLRARVHAARGVRGVVRVRRAVDLADPGSGSPAETRARLLLHDAGFTGLRHGIVVRDEHGQWLSAPDLADASAGVAVQYDGLVHLEGGPEQWQSDVDRDELTRQAGWEVVVLTGRDLRLPHLAVQKVRGAYERAAARPAPRRPAASAADCAVAPHRAPSDRGATA